MCKKLVSEAKLALGFRDGTDGYQTRLLGKTSNVDSSPQNFATAIRKSLPRKGVTMLWQSNSS